jgi:hypothetical protein
MCEIFLGKLQRVQDCALDYGKIGQCAPKPGLNLILLQYDCGGRRLTEFCEFDTQLVGGAEQRVLDGIFGCVQHRGHGLQLQPLIVFQLKNHALARG